jgi:hypothetical protein
MTRLTRTVVAGLIASTACVPAWMHLPFAGAATLQAQQSKGTSRASKADSDDDNDSDSDNESDSDDRDQAAVVNTHGKGSERTLEIARMFHAARDTSTMLHVDVSYGTGSLFLSPATGPWLYDVHLSYQAKDNWPTVLYDSLTRSLHVSGTKHGDMQVSFDDHHSHGDDDLRVALARAVPLDLSLTFGGGDVTAQLGGLSVRRLKVAAGAADAQISFSSPDPIPLEELDLKIGAAGFLAAGLGNAHVKHMVVRAAAGDIDLDFGGQWTGDATLDVAAAFGAVHIHVPRDVTIDTDRSKVVIGSKDDSGLGTAAPQSPGGRIYHLHVRSTTTLGSIDFDRKTRE